MFQVLSCAQNTALRAFRGAANHGRALGDLGGALPGDEGPRGVPQRARALRGAGGALRGAAAREDRRRAHHRHPNRGAVRSEGEPSSTRTAWTGHLLQDTLPSKTGCLAFRCQRLVAGIKAVQAAKKRTAGKAHQAA